MYARITFLICVLLGPALMAQTRPNVVFVLADDYPHYYHAPATTPCGAVRSENWKLIEWFEDGRVELYDLSDDEREERDTSRDQPERVAKLKDKLAAWRNKVNASMPTKRQP